MDQTTDAGHSAGTYHDDVLFAKERSCYLRYFAECGATPTLLRIKRSELMWIAMRLGPDASSEGVDIEALRRIATERQQAYGAGDAAQRVVGTGRSWASISRLVA